MFAIPGIAALVFLIYVRPQEFLDFFKSAPFFYIFFGLAVLGFVVDLRLRLTKLMATPQLGWVILYYVWCLVTDLIKAPQALFANAISLIIVVTVYFLIAHGAQTFKSFSAIAVVVLSMVLFVSSVAVHQAFSPFGCVALDTSNEGDASGIPDGRSCETTLDCYGRDRDPGASYMCERIGLFGTTSVARGRVRYRGLLQDPNELSLTACIGIPLAFAFYETRRSLPRLFLVIFTILAVLICIVFSQSRGAILVFLAVMGAYFIRKYGIRGAIAGAVFALPLLVLGKTDRADAEASSTERLECWYAGMHEMWRPNPLVGVGQGRFTEHHFLTAHNTYILEFAELGLIGMALFLTILYISTKIPILAVKAYADGDEVLPARAWSIAILACMAGLIVGIFFLSFSYHYVFWIYLGLTGALYSAIRTHDKNFEVKFGWVDAAIVLTIEVILWTVLFMYTKFKVGG